MLDPLRQWKHDVELTLTDGSTFTLTLDRYANLADLEHAIADGGAIRLTSRYAPGPERYVNGRHVKSWTVEPAPAP